MINSKARFALLSSASTAIAVFLLPATAQAQSTTCSQITTTITCVDGANTVLTAATDPITTTVAGPGLVTVNTTGASNVAYTATGPIATTGVSAVNLTSTGGALNFTPAGTTAPVNISTTGGIGANGLVLNTAGQAATVTVGNISTTGATSYGVLANGGTDLTLKTGDISVTGAGSTAIDAVAQTGNININAGNITATGRGLRTAATGTNTIVVGNVTAGDRGILANGSTVSVNAGNITTSTNGGTTPGGYGIAAQASTGNATVRTGAVSTVNGAGIVATSAGLTGAVDIGGCSSVSTTGNNSTAVVGQTNGTGSVTINCGALTTTGDNSNGVFSNSNGGNVLVTTGAVNTAGVGAYGITANTAGAGTVTINAGNVATTGVGSTGIFSRANTGLVDVGYGNITTSGIASGGNSAAGLDILTNGAVNLHGANSTIRTNGAGTYGALIYGSAITGNLGNVTTTGAGAQGALITATGPVNLTVGNVASTGTGLAVNAGANSVNLTTGTVTATELGATGTAISSTGAITFNGGKQTANGANALRIIGGAAPINVTVAGAATTNGGNAVSVSGTGPLTLTNTGSITTSGVNSSGIFVTGVTTAAVSCGNVATTGANSAAVSLAAAGTTNLTCGTVSTTGVASDGIVVSNTAGTTTVTGGTTTATGLGSRGIVVSSSAPAATGLVTVNTGAVTANGNAVIASSTGGANVVVNTTGNVASTTGTGVSATTAGTTLVNIAAGNTVTGVQGVNLAGTAGNTLIVNGALSNTGGTTPYTVLAGGPFTLTLGSAGSITGPLAFTTGNDTFNNQGTFALPVALDFLTGTDVLNNSGTLTAFAGNHSILGLETLNNSGLIDMRNGVATNSLTLAGTNYVASGNAALGIDVVGNGNVNLADKLVIGGTTTGTTTVLANFVNPVVDLTGPLIVDTTLNNLTAGQFVLGGNAQQGLIDYGIQVRGGDAYLVSTADSRVYDTVFVGRQLRDLWYSSADAYSSYATARRISFGQERSHPLGIWAQLYGERQTNGDQNRTATAFGSTFTINDRIRTDIRGAQGGLDFGSSNFVIGVTGGYERANGTTPNGALIHTEGHNYGAYAQFGMTSGLYAGVLVKRDDLRTIYTNDAIANGFAQPKSRTDGIEGEVGLRTGGSDKINFDFGVGFAYVHTNFDAFNFGNIAFARDELTSERGQAHARATFAGGIAPFIEVRGFHEFRDSNRYLLQSGLATSTLDGANKGTWARIEAGIGGGNKGGPLLSAWANVGDTTGFGLRAGFRF
ncbi:MAG: beta strand repeat-containing protein [Novosphingobium sp.]